MSTPRLPAVRFSRRQFLASTALLLLATACGDPTAVSTGKIDEPTATPFAIGGRGGTPAASPRSSPAAIPTPASAASSQPAILTTPGATSSPAPSPSGASTSVWKNVKSWLYQLQKLDIDAVMKSKFDLLVTDYSANGTDPQRYTAEQVARLKQHPNGRRLVISYMSIGEAESYRFYWQGWRQGSPAFVKAPNPKFPDNYTVEYWRPEWKKIIFGSPDAYLDKILDAGFDGVYLDLIEAYEIFEDEHKTAREDMVQFVREIAEYAHVKRGKPEFGIFPQNGEPLEEIPGYLDIVTGIGREDIYYGNPDDNIKSPGKFTQELEQHLDQFLKAEKLVLTVDYTTRPDQIADGYRKARAKGYVHYATVRPLDQLTINKGQDPE